MMTSSIIFITVIILPVSTYFFPFFSETQLNLNLSQLELDCRGNGLEYPSTTPPTHETLPDQLAGDMCVQLYSDTPTRAATLYYNRLSLILAI
jgi:hypothetical protein